MQTHCQQVEWQSASVQACPCTFVPAVWWWKSSRPEVTVQRLPCPCKALPKLLHVQWAAKAGQARQGAPQPQAQELERACSSFKTRGTVHFSVSLPYEPIGKATLLHSHRLCTTQHFCPGTHADQEALHGLPRKHNLKDYKNQALHILPGPSRKTSAVQ